MLEVGAPSEAVGVAGAQTEVVLKVTPVNESAFRAKARMASSALTPRVGDQVQVKFDPQKRRRLIVTG